MAPRHPLERGKGAGNVVVGGTLHGGGEFRPETGRACR